ncbi:MAG: peptidylprolyl isomerase [bacterium]
MKRISARSISIMIFMMIGLQFWAVSQPTIKVKRSDLKRDVLMRTDSGDIVIRLSDSTPIHRDNFIRLVRSGFYKGIGFHRVIYGFMIQAGDEKSRANADSTAFLKNYTLPAEFRPSLFHKKGVIAAARMGDNVNPQKESSGTQFYVVQGKQFTNAGLDSTETLRLKGRKIPDEHRMIYKTIGGAPHLDQNYTIFGELVSGIEVVDKIASTKTTGREGGDKPLQDIRILKTAMVKRKN